MRTKDLEAGKPYATCNGEMVVPVKPVHAHYYREWDDKTKAWVVKSNPPAVAGDPWGPCHTAANGAPSHRRGKPGVLVDVFDVDRNGRKVGEPTGQKVVLPKDIGGPWTEYLALHADAVKARADKATALAKSEAEVEAVKAAVRELFGVDATITLHARYNRGKQVSITFEADSYRLAVNEMRRAVKRAAKRLE